MSHPAPSAGRSRSASACGSRSASSTGRASCGARSVIAYTVSVLHLPALPARTGRVLRVIWIAWAACGNSIPAAMVTTLSVRIPRRPCAVAVARCAVWTWRCSRTGTPSGAGRRRVAPGPRTGSRLRPRPGRGLAGLGGWSTRATPPDRPRAGRGWRGRCHGRTRRSRRTTAHRSGPRTPRAAGSPTHRGVSRGPSAGREPRSTLQPATTPLLGRSLARGRPPADPGRRRSGTLQVRARAS